MVGFYTAGQLKNPQMIRTKTNFEVQPSKLL